MVRMTQSTPTTTPDLSAKASLARLMAAENLTVDIQPKARTAAFDLMNRTLILPLWNVKNETYDMLVGHEVSHAVYTPGGWALHDACSLISEKHRHVARDYINVVEDARIERLIKVKFPGLRRSFAEGYRDLMESDFLGIKGKDLNTFGFLDRINIHYKMGWIVNVPFSDKELPLARRVAETKTWDEVVALSKEIYEFAKEEQKQQQKQQQEPQKGNPSPEDEKGEEQDSDEQQQGSKPESEKDEQGSESEEAEGEDSSTGSEGEGNEPDDSEGKGPESDTAGDGEAESEEAEGKDGDETDEVKGRESDDEIAPEGSQTAKALANALEELAQQNAAERVKTVDLPTKWDRELVVPFSTIETTMDGLTGDKRPVADKLVETWKAQEGPNIQALWTEFERKKAADRFQRTAMSPTGRLDPMRLAYHKVSDDIFKSMSVVSKGKNHGFVLFLDMSGSMNDKIFPTMIQLANLAAFCRRANLPFVVYGFSETRPHQKLFGGRHKKLGFGSDFFKGTGCENVDTNGLYFRIYTLLESGTSQGRFQKQLGNLFLWAATFQTDRYQWMERGYVNVIRGKGLDRTWSYDAEGLGLHSTPTTTALMLGVELVTEFKVRHRLQVVNTMVLTDGQGTDTPLSQVKVPGSIEGVYETVKPIIRDPMTRREYHAYQKNLNGVSGGWELTRGQQQTLMAQILRDRTGGSVTSIMLVNHDRKRGDNIHSGLRGTVTASYETLKKFTEKVVNDTWGCMENPGQGYTHVAVMMIPDRDKSGNGEKDFNDLSVDSLTSKRAMNSLSKTFIGALSERKTNRALMSKIADIVSGNRK